MKLGIVIGDTVRFAKTVGETDVYLFAGITGDLAPNHVDEKAMQATRFGRRMAHGALLIGYMSTCSTMMSQKAAANGAQGIALSLGFDRIRFLSPVYLGDTIGVDYTVARIDADRRRAIANVRITNQHDTLVAVAEHVLGWAADGSGA